MPESEPLFDRLTQMQYVGLAYGISALVLIALALLLLISARRLKARLRELEARRAALLRERAGDGADADMGGGGNAADMGSNGNA